MSGCTTGMCGCLNSHISFQLSQLTHTDKNKNKKNWIYVVNPVRL